MKFNPFQWKEVKTNETLQAPKGRLLLRLSAPCPVYVSSEGYQALLGFASDFDATFSEPVEVEIAAPKGVRAFCYEPEGASFVALGESFTNIDRMPSESGMLAEVTRARRQFEIEKRQMLNEMRHEAAVLRACMRESNISKKAKPDADGVEPIDVPDDKTVQPEVTTPPAKLDVKKDAAK